MHIQSIAGLNGTSIISDSKASEMPGSGLSTGVRSCGAFHFKRNVLVGTCNHGNGRYVSGECVKLDFGGIPAKTHTVKKPLLPLPHSTHLFHLQLCWLPNPIAIASRAL